MCSLFGLIDHKSVLPVKERIRIISVLAEECEVRGTDASGIAYNSNGRLHIYKRPLPAHKIRFRLPTDANVIMGHTRMTTQGSEKFNYNNHPFYGKVIDTEFALAHNGILYNDDVLRVSENLPQTKIQTDSYVAVQLIEKSNYLSLKTLKEMAEKTRGSFCYTVLDDKNDLYIVKGDNPIDLYCFDGFYIYASTENILKNALSALNMTNYEKVDIRCGDILKIDRFGQIETGSFEYYDPYDCIASCSVYDPYTYLNDLTEYGRYFGIEDSDIMMLAEFGFDETEIEELLYEPTLMKQIIDEIKSEVI